MPTTPDLVKDLCERWGAVFAAERGTAFRQDANVLAPAWPPATLRCPRRAVAVGIA
jgi:hypothetical protein